jgi:hypothetical protein
MIVPSHVCKLTHHQARLWPACMCRHAPNRTGCRLLCTQPRHRGNALTRGAARCRDGLITDDMVEEKRRMSAAILRRLDREAYDRMTQYMAFDMANEINLHQGADSGESEDIGRCAPRCSPPTAAALSTRCVCLASSATHAANMPFACGSRPVCAVRCIHCLPCRGSWRCLALAARQHNTWVLGVQQYVNTGKGTRSQLHVCPVQYWHRFVVLLIPYAEHWHAIWSIPCPCEG